MSAVPEKTSVDVVVFTHNHAAFIEQALESVLSQRGNFDLKIRVHDDNSTDGTGAIIQRLLGRAGVPFELVISERNRYTDGSLFRWEFLSECQGDFIAFLDGDDFWTSPDKLRRQLEVIQRDRDIALVHHAFSGLRGDALRNFLPPRAFQKGLLPGVTLADHNFIGTSTVMVRRSALPERIPDGYNECRGVDDYPLWALITDKRLIAYLSDDMAVYRIHPGQNFANLPSRVQSRMLLGALVFITNSVDPVNRDAWVSAIIRHTERQLVLQAMPKTVRPVFRRIFFRLRRIA